MTIRQHRTLDRLATATVGLFLSVIAGSMPGSPAFAASSAAKELAAIDAEVKRCQDTDSSTAGLKQCAYDALSSADKVLNNVYKAAVASYKKKSSDEQEAKDNKESLDRLIASEVAWIKYRDTECELQGTSMLGGTGEGLVIADCQYSMTAKRAKDLDELFNSQ